MPAAKPPPTPPPPLPFDLKALVEQGVGTMRKLPPNQRLFSQASDEASPVDAKSPKPPRGDIFAHTMPAPRKPRKRKVKAAEAKEQRPSDQPEPYVDPFTDWKKCVVDKNKMSFAQLQMQSDEGRAQLTTSLKQQTKIFKRVDLTALNALSSDRLYENRTFFSKSGMWASEVGRRREEAWNKKYHPPSQKELRRLEEEKDLFEHYGVRLKRGSTEPTLKDLNKLMSVSYESSPLVKEQRRQEALEAARLEDRERIERELEMENLRKQSLHGLKMGRPGEGIFSFG